MEFNLTQASKQFKPVTLNITFHSEHELNIFHDLIEKAEYLNNQSNATQSIMLLTIQLENILKLL